MYEGCIIIDSCKSIFYTIFSDPIYRVNSLVDKVQTKWKWFFYHVFHDILDLC